MEFASEMVVKSTLLGQRMVEVPTTLKKDGRSRPPHLRTWRDGWRHLRFLLMYSPRWLFLIPGLALMILGFALMVWLLPAERPLGHVNLGVDTLAYAAAAVLLGFQLVFFGVAAKVFATTEGLLPEDPSFERWFRYITLETGLVAGALLLLVGLGIAISSVFSWAHTGYGPLPPVRDDAPYAARDALPHARYRGLLRQLLPQPARLAQTLNPGGGKQKGRSTERPFLFVMKRT